jgi:hypothetical protein
MLRFLRPAPRLVLVTAAACAIPTVALLACSSFSSDAPTSPPGTEGGPEGSAPVDAASGDADVTPEADAGHDAATCDLSKPFQAGTPVTMDSTTAVNSNSSNNYGAWLSADELRIVFATTRDGSGTIHLYAAARTDRSQPFGPPSRLNTTVVNTVEERPSFSPDGTLIAYSSPAAPRDLYVGAVESQAVISSAKVVDFSSTSDDREPFLGSGGELFWSTNLGGGFYRLYRGTFTAPDGGTTGATAGPLAGDVNATKNNYAPIISADGRTLYFASDRDTGGANIGKIYVATRANEMSDFGTAAAVPNVSPSSPTFDDRPNWVSPDDCRLYFQSDRGDGKLRIYVSERK